MKDASISDFDKKDTRKSSYSSLLRHHASRSCSSTYSSPAVTGLCFGTMEDGEELFVHVMNTLQDQGEKPSAYLQRPQVALNLTVQRGGVKREEVDRHLLKQLCRGCWNEGLLTELLLEHTKNNPPPFAELLMLLRTAEE